MAPMPANETDTARLRTTVSDGIPPDAIQLMWRVFFASRNRGVSPEFHFPWIHDKHGLHCVCMSAEASQPPVTVAALVLRQRALEQGGKIGLIGLVCVAEEFRGRGLSTQLLELAIQQAKSLQLSHLVLWTTKPEVYEKLGFKVDNTDMFGPVKKRGGTQAPRHAAQDTHAVVATPLEGAPAFAQEVVRYATANATIIVCKSSTTETLVAHTGPMDEVAALIDEVMPNVWNLNTPTQAPIIETLSQHGYEHTLKPSAVRMSLPLTSDGGRVGSIPFLDRI